MYLNILKKSTARISTIIENYFSFYLQHYKTTKDRDKLLRQLLLKLFTDKGDEEQFVDAYEETIVDSYVELMYKYIWFKLKSLDIKDFGTTFFKEYNDQESEYQIHLLFKYMKLL